MRSQPMRPTFKSELIRGRGKLLLEGTKLFFLGEEAGVDNAKIQRIQYDALHGFLVPMSRLRGTNQPPVQHHRAKSECGANHHLASKGVPLNVNPREACGSVGDTPLQLKLSRPNLGINGYLDRIADYTDRHTVLGQSARTGRRYWL